MPHTTKENWEMNVDIAQQPPRPGSSHPRGREGAGCVLTPSLSSLLRRSKATISAVSLMEPLPTQNFCVGISERKLGSGATSQWPPISLTHWTASGTIPHSQELAERKTNFSPGQTRAQAMSGKRCQVHALVQDLPAQQLGNDFPEGKYEERKTKKLLYTVGRLIRIKTRNKNTKAKRCKGRLQTWQGNSAIKTPPLQHQ